jgi:hypothetical protein
MASSLNKTIKAAKMYTEHIVTHRLNMFLMQNPNLILDDWVVDLISDELKKKPRNRSASFSSSASGDCPRKQIYNYIGIDSGGVNDPQLQNIFYDGTWRHLRWQATLLQAGILSEIEMPLSWDEKRSKGSMDGFGIVPDDHPNEKWRGLDFGFELKGMNTYGYKANQGKPTDKHLDQVHRYFLVGGFDLFVILYEDKNTQQWTEWVIEPDPERIAKQEQELILLNDYADKKLIPPMLSKCMQRKGDDWKWCQFAGDQGVCVQRDQW